MEIGFLSGKSFFYLKTNFNTYNNNFAFCHLNENILTFSNKKPAHVFTTSSREKHRKNSTRY